MRIRVSREANSIELEKINNKMKRGLNKLTVNTRLSIIIEMTSISRRDLTRRMLTGHKNQFTSKEVTHRPLDSKKITNTELTIKNSIINNMDKKLTTMVSNIRERAPNIKIEGNKNISNTTKRIIIIKTILNSLKIMVILEKMKLFIERGHQKEGSDNKMLQLSLKIHNIDQKEKLKITTKVINIKVIQKSLNMTENLIRRAENLIKLNNNTTLNKILIIRRLNKLMKEGDPGLKKIKLRMNMLMILSSSTRNQSISNLTKLTKSMKEGIMMINLLASLDIPREDLDTIRSSRNNQKNCRVSLAINSTNLVRTIVNIKIMNAEVLNTLLMRGLDQLREKIDNTLLDNKGITKMRRDMIAKESKKIKKRLRQKLTSMKSILMALVEKEAEANVSRKAPTLVKNVTQKAAGVEGLEKTSARPGVKMKKSAPNPIRKRRMKSSQLVEKAPLRVE